MEAIIRAGRSIREIFIKFETKRKRKRYDNYDNKDVTILSRNCVAGVIYHDLGLQFQSPTINLWIEHPDFLIFLKYLHDFLGGGINRKKLFI